MNVSKKTTIKTNVYIVTTYEEIQKFLIEKGIIEADMILDNIVVENPSMVRFSFEKIESYMGASSAAFSSPEYSTDQEKFLDTPFKDLDLDVRQLHPLKAHDILTPRILVEDYKCVLPEMQNFGKKSFTAVKELMASKGFTIASVKKW